MRNEEIKREKEERKNDEQKKRKKGLSTPSFLMYMNILLIHILEKRTTEKQKEDTTQRNKK